MIVDFRAQIPILVTSFVAAAEAPIHVDVPNETIDCLDHCRDEIEPEGSVFFVFEANIAGSGRTTQPEGEKAGQHRAEILPSIDQVNSFARILIPIDTLPEAEPVGKDSEHIIEVEGRLALTILCWLRLDPRHELLLLIVALDV